LLKSKSNFKPLLEEISTFLNILLKEGMWDNKTLIPRPLLLEKKLPGVDVIIILTFISYFCTLNEIE